MTGCPVDVYFLADNTGSMGGYIDGLQTGAEAMLAALNANPGFDFRFGVGAYEDFPLPDHQVWYGNTYFDTAPLAAVTVGPGGTLDVPFGAGPRPVNWPVVAPTASQSGPVSTVTLPVTSTGAGSSRHNYYALTSKLYISAPPGTSGSITMELFSDITGSIQNTFLSTTSPSWPVIEVGRFEYIGTAGENVSVRITSSLSQPAQILWRSYFRVKYYDDQGEWDQGPYGFFNISPITADLARVIDGMEQWEADDGGDTTESWLYSLWRLAVNRDNEIGWRPKAAKYVVVLGDAPSHDPICPILTGESIAITEAVVTTEMVSNKIHFLGAGIEIEPPGTPGLDDDPTHGSGTAGGAGGSYTHFGCTPNEGTALQATRMATATDGLLVLVTDPDTISTALTDLILDQAKCARRAFVPWVGHIS